MRGDPPFLTFCINPLAESTPHARGSTTRKGEKEKWNRVYPACAGIHPLRRPVSMRKSPISHARGSTLHSKPSTYPLRVYFPHARGSTRYVTVGNEKEVYPACAGIHPTSFCSPRVCLFACAGIHPRNETRSAGGCRLPRMRGDPPFYSRFLSHPALSTPHARGSTFSHRKSTCISAVYPACAGIHLKNMKKRKLKNVYPACAGIHLSRPHPSQ